MNNLKIERLREILKKWQCEICREGKPCHCNIENAKAFIEDENGKRKYFCNIGCIMLKLDDENLIKLIESQFNIEGHYEKLRNH